MMGWTDRILVIYAQWYFLTCALCWGVDLPEPIQEGQIYSFTCAGQTKSEKRNLYWKRSSEPVSYCYWNQSCIDLLPTEYEATCSSDKFSFNSHLIIFNVSPRDRHAVFDCVVHDYIDQKDVKMGSWSLPRTYFPPQHLKCAVTTDLETINVSCEVLMFYPDVECKMRKTLNGNTENEGIGMQRRNQTAFSGTDSYHNGSCYSVVHLAQPGNYSFNVDVFPRVDTYTPDSVTLKWSSWILVPDTPTVRVQFVQSFDCSNYTRLECKAFWFRQGSSRFEWCLDRNPIPEGFVDTLVNNAGDYYVHKSVLKLRHVQLSKGQNVTCIFYLNHSYTQANVSSVMKNITVSYPPPLPPQFRLSDSQRTLVHDSVYIQNDANGSALCEVIGGQPAVVSVTVECARSGGSTKSFRSETNSVTFPIYEKQTVKEIRCKCYAKHVTECYNLTSSITFTFDNSVSPSWNQWTRIIGIIIGVIFLAALLFVIVAIGRIKARFNSLYSEYVYDHIIYDPRHRRHATEENRQQEVDESDVVARDSTEVIIRQETSSLTGISNIYGNIGVPQRRESLGQAGRQRDHPAGREIRGSSGRQRLGSTDRQGHGSAGRERLGSTDRQGHESAGGHCCELSRIQSSELSGRLYRGSTGKECGGSTDRQLRGSIDRERRGSTDRQRRGSTDRQRRGSTDRQRLRSTCRQNHYENVKMDTTDRRNKPTSADVYTNTGLYANTGDYSHASSSSSALTSYTNQRCSIHKPYPPRTSGSTKPPPCQRLQEHDHNRSNINHWDENTYIRPSSSCTSLSYVSVDEHFGDFSRTHSLNGSNESLSDQVFTNDRPHH